MKRNLDGSHEAALEAFVAQIADETEGLDVAPVAAARVGGRHGMSAQDGCR
ncbi:hypothetical protein [Streptomyces fagopyri]|uniref:hypothetical protein n=1 Tax=Streptomyces fagopyri TaxID=2662397 RepID=UPI003808F75E